MADRTCNTRTRVRLVVVVETGTDAWHPDDKLYRPFDDAKRRAVERIREAFSATRGTVTAESMEVVEVLMSMDPKDVITSDELRRIVPAKGGTQP